MKILRWSGDVDLSDEAELAITLAVGRIIEDGGDWYGEFVERIASATRHDADNMADLLEEHAFFTEALAYTQFGNPEHLVIAVRPSTGKKEANGINEGGRDAQ